MGAICFSTFSEPKIGKIQLNIGNFIAEIKTNNLLHIFFDIDPECQYQVNKNRAAKVTKLR